MKRPAPPQDRPPSHPTCTAESSRPAGNAESRQVAWFTTYEFAQAVAARYGYDLAADRLPTPGTPAWCGMADNDARKLLALLQRGIEGALDDDAHQTTMADASREISSAAPWRSLAQRAVRGRGPAYIPRTKEASS